MRYPRGPRAIPLFFALLLLVSSLAGCALWSRSDGPQEAPALIRLPPWKHPSFADDIKYDGLVRSIGKSLSYLERVPSHRHFSFGADRFDRDHMVKSLEAFQAFIQRAPSLEELKDFIRRRFFVYRATGNQESNRVLFTGYYEPLIKGSLQRTEQFRYPIYAKPEDLVQIDLSPFSPELAGRRIAGRYANGTVVPYYSRKAIDYDGVLEGKVRALAWVRDRVDLFFLQIQGSGKILLGQGEAIHVHYHASNGRPYSSIGKLLIEEGEIPRSQMSMQGIREYLRTHPEKSRRILGHNQSYVFFKLEEDGPLGYINETLTPGRSIATDGSIFPISALSFIELKKPLTDGSGQIRAWTDMKRFVLNQDVGGAIKGPGRADLFWGNGPYAEIAAGHTQHEGDLYFLVLRPDAAF